MILCELRLLILDLEIRGDYFRGDLRDDGIARGAEASHPGGNPMSQRENAGFSWPGFAVSAVEPHGISPESTNWAWRGSWSSLLRPSTLVTAIPGLSFQSRVVAVTHPARIAE